MTLEDRLQKDLTYTQMESLMSEQIYPYWENVFAVIIGAFFVVYFQSVKEHERIILAFVAFLFCLSWFRLASRNRHFARARTDRRKQIEIALNKVASSDKKRLVAENHGVDLFMLYKDVGLYIDRCPKWSEKKSTWEIRVSLTRHLSLIWLGLVLYSAVLLLYPSLQTLKPAG